jgi:cytochrome c-type protein NapC
LANLQTAKAQTFHLAMKKNGKTCIDCHAGIAHGSPSAINLLGAP